MIKLLSESEAADHLGVSPRTLANWRSRGGGPAYVRVGGKAVRYRFADLQEFVEESIRRHTSEYEEDDDDEDLDESDEDDD
jgi:excisionase family DNA binding protein